MKRREVSQQIKQMERMVLDSHLFLSRWMRNGDVSSSPLWGED